MISRGIAVTGAVVLALAGTTTMSAAATPSLASTATTATVTTIPYQYISKVYTESLGRLPSQREWRSGVEFFARQGCRSSSLARWGMTVFDSSEFEGLHYDPIGVTLVGYRAILNRDPVEDEWREVDRAGKEFAAGKLFGHLYSSPAFRHLTASICNASEPSYHFGTVEAPTLPTGPEGFVGTQTELQDSLNSTPRGGSVRMATRAVVRLSSTLTVPAGVTLTTDGAPGTRHYAYMARLVRVNANGGYNAPMIRVLPGGSLNHVWVDGQMGDPQRFVGHAAYSVQTMSGAGTQVSNNRLTNPAGGTNLSALGGADTGTACTNNDFSHNLVDGYANSHYARLLDNGGVVGPWADGLSIACEDASVVGNQIVDATDVGLIVFAEAGRTQRSQLTDNVILNAGNSGFASMDSSPGLNPTGVGDVAGEARMDFTGTLMARNLFWTSPAAPNAIGISVGVRPWTAQYSYNGRGIRVEDNTSGQEGVWAGNGIIVSGMLDVSVKRNAMNYHQVTGAPLCTTAVEGIFRQCGTPSRTSLCEPGKIGVDLEGFASGEIQGAFTRRSYSGCIVGFVEH